jgi:hypothetical protein
MLQGMFIVTAADAAAIRAAFEAGGELLAAVELRRRFPGVEDMAEARTWARAIAAWQPIALPDPPAKAARVRRPGRG